MVLFHESHLGMEDIHGIVLALRNDSVSSDFDQIISLA